MAEPSTSPPPSLSKWGKLLSRPPSQIDISPAVSPPPDFNPPNRLPASSTSDSNSNPHPTAKQTALVSRSSSRRASTGAHVNINGTLLPLDENGVMGPRKSSRNESRRASAVLAADLRRKSFHVGVNAGIGSLPGAHPMSTAAAMIAADEVDIDADSTHESFEVVDVSQYWLIHPNGFFRRVWEIILALFVIYSAAATPYRIAFDTASRGPVYYVELCMDMMFIVDLMMTFRICIYDNGELVIDSRTIAARYLRGWFFIDLVSSLPLDLIMTNISATQSANVTKFPRLLRILRLIRLVRLPRLFRLTRIFRKWSPYISINIALLRIMKLCTMLIILAHYSACGWFFVSTMENTDEDTWWTIYKTNTRQSDTPFEQYISSFHWAITTLTTVGYGDIIPYTTVERVYVICFMIIGVTAFAFVVGNMSALVQQMDTTAKARQEKTEQINQWIQFRKFPKELQIQIRDHFHYLWYL